MSNRFFMTGLAGVGVTSMMVATLVVGATPALAVPADFAAKADAYVKSSWPANGPGVAVLVTERGKTVYKRGQGFADVEVKTPITTKTVFRLASMTKQLAAVTLLQLVDEGKVSLNDPVSKYVPQLPQPGGSATIRQILNHTSGIKSYTNISTFMRENDARPQTTESLIAAFKDVPPPSKPGEEWYYNNSGYVLVGAVIEKVTGKPWYQAVEERISKPLHLTSVRYGVGEESIPGMAKGYARGKQGPKLADKVHLSVPHAAGAFVGSIEDMATFEWALHHGKLLKPATYKQMIAPTKLQDGRDYPYGLGMELWKVRGSAALGHTGDMQGFHTIGMYLPEKDIVVTVFVNDQASPTQPQVAGPWLAALALGKPYADPWEGKMDISVLFPEAKVDPASLEPFFGVYRPKNGKGERQFFSSSDRFFTKVDGEQERVYHTGGNRFSYGPFSLTWFGMKRDASGTPVMEVHPQEKEETETWVRTGPLPK